MKITDLGPTSLATHNAAMDAMDKGDYLVAVGLEVETLRRVVEEGQQAGKPRLRTIMITAGSVFWLARKAYKASQEPEVGRELVSESR